ncbi:MAG: flagellar basal body-associated FliL family protein [bacterium]
MESATQAPIVDAPEAKKGKPFALIGIVVLGLALGTGAGLFVVGPRLTKRAAAPIAVAAGEKATGEGAAKGEAKGEAGPSTLHVVDNLVLNPAGTGGTRFLMVNATIEVKDAGAVAILKEKDTEVRDVLLTLLGRKTVDELTRTDFRDSLKKEIIVALSPMLPKGSLKRVFFPQFVIQ